MIDKKKLIKIIAKSLKINEKKIDMNSKKDKLENWDSLGHLTILTEIDKIASMRLYDFITADVKETIIDQNKIDFDFIIIHETAHEWWGNNISMGNINDMWIHESFATYAEALYVEEMYSYDDMLVYLNHQKNYRILFG